jgi:SpoVK/Ycf46/Vps4 family AAA+-type ATPase
MTAGVIGNHLGLDVFRIDLSGVVSKYIGETEKNLDRVFAAARGSQSILFFDEADALFGKRSEVQDAHDRYANIEVAYLLQKFEDHNGPVILATNLRRNIDDAFSRRLHCVVEFPAPDEQLRLKLWLKIFPRQTPLAADIDFRFVASHFQLTGGDIRNVALDAAFLAAQDGGVVTMRELASALNRQLLKQGKAPSISDFKQYHALI